MSFRRYARLLKRAGRLLTGRDVLYSHDIRPRKASLGSDYGGWTIAVEGLDSSSTVYSFGVGNDVSFDLAVIRRFGCNVHAFDPSPPVADWISTQDLPANYTFHPYGLAPKDGEISFFAPSPQSGMFSTSKQHRYVSNTEVKLPVQSLSTTVASLGSPTIDILKIDVEGAEYDLIPSIIQCPVPIKQLMIEFHHRIGIGSLEATVKSVQQLRSSGFQLFHVSETSSEFSFLHRTNR
jgi:FkbM family methyltransferase